MKIFHINFLITKNSQITVILKWCRYNFWCSAGVIIGLPSADIIAYEGNVLEVCVNITSGAIGTGNSIPISAHTTDIGSGECNGFNCS